MSKFPEEYLNHILQECNYILTVSELLKKFDELEQSEDYKRSLARSIEIIGEAAKNIPVDVKLKWNEVNWKEIMAMRNKLVHEYFGVNYLIVWDVIKNKIPSLKITVEKILADK